MPLSFFRKKDENPFLNAVKSTVKQTVPFGNVATVASGISNAANQLRKSSSYQPQPQQNYTPARNYSSEQYPPQPKPQPKPQPRPTPQPTQTPSPVDAINARMRQLGQTQQQGIQQRANEQRADLERLNQAQQQNIQAQIPELEKRLQTFREQMAQSGMNLGQAAQEQKQAIEDASGRQLRQQLELDRSRQNNLVGIFGKLGSLDSSGFQKQLVGQSSRAQADQQSLLEQRTRDLNQVDRELFTARSQAELAIQDEVAKFNQAIRNLSVNMVEGSFEYNQALRQLAANTEANINQIQNDLYQNEIALEQQKQQLAMGGDINYQNLSEGFLKTGIPETRDDYIYQRKEGEGQNTAKTQQQKQETVNLIDELLNSDLGPVTGALRLGSYIPGSNAKATQAKLNQLKSQLTLNMREMLKGSGAISDFESKMLEQAAAALDQAQSEEAVRSELNRIKAALSGTQSMSPQSMQIGNYLVSQG